MAADDADDATGLLEFKTLYSKGCGSLISKYTSTRDSSYGGVTMEADDERNLEEARNAKMQKRPELDDYSEASVVEIDSDEEDESEFWNEDTSVNEENDITDGLSDDDESRNARASVINIESRDNSDHSFIEAGSEEKVCSTKGVTKNRDIESLPFESRTNELISIDDFKGDLIEAMTSDDSGCNEDYPDQNSGDESHATVSQRRSFRPQQRLKRKLEKRCQETTGGGIRQAHYASTLRRSRKPSVQHRPNEDLWDEMFERLVRYNDTSGHTRVPQRYKDDPSLGNWVKKQRCRYRTGQISERRKACLNTIAFEWNPGRSNQYGRNDRSWSQMYECLVQYKHTNGHTRVPQRYKDDPSLGNWVVRQRYHYRKGKLSEQRQARLKSIGFEWKPPRIAVTNDRSWNKVYERLVQYKDANGHTRVPKRYKDDPGLRIWVRRQRYHYNEGKLSEQRQARLKSIGFEWNPGSAIGDWSWKKMYERRIQYKDQTGHTRVPYSYKSDPSLGKWVVKQPS